MKKLFKKWIVLIIITGTLFLLFRIMLMGKSEHKENFGTTENIALNENTDGEDITEQLSEGEFEVMRDGSKVMTVGEGGVVTVRDDDTGTSWSNAALNDAVDKFAPEKDAASSPYTLQYRYNREQNVEFNTQTESVARNQYRVYLGKNKIITEYLLGDCGSDLLVPKGIPKDRFEKEILAKLDETDQNYLLRRYTLFTNKTADKLVAGTCPGVAATDLYYLTDGEAATKQRKISGILEQVGYTQQDYEEDILLTKEVKPKYNEVFRLTVEYWLDHGDLMVNIPCSQILFNPANPLLKINFNDYFSYANDSDDGYYVMMTGSGALHSLGGDRDVTHTYDFYGQDRVNGNSDIHQNTDLSFPVYGMVKNQNGFLAIIENGAEVADLVEKHTEGASSIYPSFHIVEYDDVSITSNNVSSVFGRDAYKGDIRIRYHFFEGSHANYSEMACYYRDYLEKSGTLKKETDQASKSLLLELIGSVQLKTQIIGMIPTTQKLVLTNFQQCGLICDSLDSAGISDFSLKISGFNQRGLYAQTPGKYDWSGMLGSDAERNEFLDRMKNKNIDTYLDVNMAYYYNDIWGDGYDPKAMNARSANNGITRLLLTSKANGDALKQTGIQVVSPLSYSVFAKQYEETLDKRLSISIGDSAGCLNTDFNTDAYCQRETSAEKMFDSIGLLSKNRKIMAEKAVAYLLPQLSMVEEIKLYDTQEYECLSEIPFIQMVLSGDITYTTEPLNASSDHQKSLLEAIETGSVPKYTLAYSLPRNIMLTEYKYLFYISYPEWKDTMIKDVQYVNEALKGLKNLQIVHHEINGTVRKVTYSNGTMIYVNYGDTAARIDGVDIAANSYSRVG